MARRIPVLALLVLLAPLSLLAQATNIDVAIVKTAPATVNTGTGFNYVLTVTNNGAAIADATVQDILPASPAQMTATAVVPSQGTCTPAPTTTVTCNIGPLASLASATITITTSAPAAGFYSNTATVATQGDSNPANDSSTVRTLGLSNVPAIPTAGTWALLSLAALLILGAFIRMR